MSDQAISKRDMAVSRLDAWIGRYKRPLYVAGIVLALAIGVLFPLSIPGVRAAPTGFIMRSLVQLIALAVMAQGWNFIGGFTGYAAFGNTAFYGIGAYTTGLLMSKSHWPFLPALLVGGLCCIVAAVLIGLPVLRLKGHYFAIATLGVAQALREIAADWDDLTGGAKGITMPFKSTLVGFFDVSSTSLTFIYYIMFVLLVASILTTFLVTRSKLGYGWLAIREDEAAARQVGVNTTLYKVVAFAMSGCFVGLAGGCWLT